MKVILALSQYHARRIASSLRLSMGEWVNGTAPHALDGRIIKGDDLILDASFWQRPDAQEVWDAVLSRLEPAPVADEADT
jgi:hypothetical protein